MTNINKKGFTLIELLVVVAIIGILATVVLSSLGSARTKAKQSAAKAALSQLRAEMELKALDNGVNGYREGASGTACLTAGSEKFLTEANTQLGTSTAACSATATAYAAKVTLESGSFFCVDSNGYANTLTSDPDITNQSCS